MRERGRVSLFWSRGSERGEEEKEEKRRKRRKEGGRDFFSFSLFIFFFFLRSLLLALKKKKNSKLHGGDASFPLRLVDGGGRLVHDRPGLLRAAPVLVAAREEEERCANDEIEMMAARRVESSMWHA